MVSIPINVAILLFTASGADTEGNMDFSATVQWLLDREAERTTFEVVLILVLVEHILLAVKVGMAQLIPDVPIDVVKAERKRPKIKEIANNEMLELKRAKSLKTIEEIMEEIAATSKQKSEAQFEAMVRREQERNEGVDPDTRALKKRKKAMMMDDLEKIQEKAMEQQKRNVKAEKIHANRLRRNERK